MENEIDSITMEELKRFKKKEKQPTAAGEIMLNYKNMLKKILIIDF